MSRTWQQNERNVSKGHLLSPCGGANEFSKRLKPPEYVCSFTFSILISSRGFAKINLIFQVLLAKLYCSIYFGVVQIILGSWFFLDSIKTCALEYLNALENCLVLDGKIKEMWLNGILDHPVEDLMSFSTVGITTVSISIYIFNLKRLLGTGIKLPDALQKLIGFTKCSWWNCILVQFTLVLSK